MYWKQSPQPWYRHPAVYLARLVVRPVSGLATWLEASIDAPSQAFN